MCQPQSRGGKRCAAHTRPKFEAASFGTPAWDEAATDYARTKQGRERITAMVMTAVADRDWDRAAACESALTRAARANEVQEEWARQRKQTIDALSRTGDLDKLRRAVASSDPEIRAAVAWNDRTPGDALMQLASDPSVDVRSTVAARPTAPDAVFEGLMDDESPAVRRALQSYVSRPLAVLDRWAESGEPRERARAAYAAHLEGHPAILERLADDADPGVRDKVAGSRSTPVHVLRRLVHDEDMLVAGQAMGNDSLPMADLESVIATQGKKVAEAGRARWGVMGGIQARLQREERFDLMHHISE